MNKEELKIRHHEYYIDHKEEIKERVRNYRQVNKTHLNNVRKKHKEEYNTRKRKWRELNKDRINELARIDRTNNPEKYETWRKRRNKEKSKISRRIYRSINKDKINLQKHSYRIKEKVIAFYVYSNEMKCALCSDSEFSHLGLDHINGGGTKHRRSIPKANCNIYGLLQQQGFPNGYRLLCQNCNYLNHLGNLVRIHERAARYRTKLKYEALEKYANPPRCNVCHTTDIRVLTLDHIDGGGRKELKELGIKGGANYYRYIRNNKRRKDLRILCFNHNCSRRIETPTDEFIKSTIQEFLESQQRQKSSCTKSSQK